jgi:hypothetical protein
MGGVQEQSREGSLKNPHGCGLLHCDTPTGLFAIKLSTRLKTKIPVISVPYSQTVYPFYRDLQHVSFRYSY